MTATARFAVVHTTEYDYPEAVSVSHHVARVSPRSWTGQTLVEHDLTVDPAPAVQASHLDYFGNTTTFCAVQGAHDHLAVKARSVVDVHRPLGPTPDQTPAWESVRDAALPLEAPEFVFESEMLPSRAVGADLSAYARASFLPERPLVEAVVDLTRRIHQDFAYDPQATTVATPIEEVFRARRGVCQDFAHLEIACLRALGLPARYVSGYLETIPPADGRPLVGADQSHAWLAVYCPGAGWVEVDPTNNVLPSDAHVTLAWGRDYSDVSPIRGVILGGGDHALAVSVTVQRIDAR